MCAPAALPLLSAGLSIGGAMAGQQAQVQQADRVNAMWDENFKSTVAAQSDRYASLNAQDQQDRLSKSQELQNKQIEDLQATARARVAGAQSGTTGTSQTALLGDYLARQDRQGDVIRGQYKIDQSHYSDELIATNDQSTARINGQASAGPVSALPTVFAALGGVTNAYASGLRNMSYTDTSVSDYSGNY